MENRRKGVMGTGTQGLGLGLMGRNEIYRRITEQLEELHTCGKVSVGFTGDVTGTNPPAETPFQLKVKEALH